MPATSPGGHADRAALDGLAAVFDRRDFAVTLTGGEDGMPRLTVLFNSREHARLNCPADVVVTFEELGTRWQRGALWQGTWSRPFPVCSACWDAIREVAEVHRPGLVIRDRREPAPPAPAEAS
jgi:hypothetical protein